MEVHYDSITGRRPQNEDKHNVILNRDRNNRQLQPINYLAVYDGHGGREVSTYLHDHLPAYFMDRRAKYPLSKKYIYQVYDHLQNSLRIKHRDYSLYTGSTSLVVTHFSKNKQEYLTVMNTGDSRCVLCRDNVGIALTKDHKPHWPEERKRIEALGGNIVYDGDDWRIKDLSVSRAFGDVRATPYVTHRPQVHRYRIDRRKDRFVILACDGLWDVVNNQEAVNFVLSARMRAKDKKKSVNIAKMLTEYAWKKGSMDNITVVIGFFN